MPRVITLITALLFGVLFSQAPEFQQQYRQRLGGALDELNRFINQFNEDALAVGVTPEAAIVRLAGNSDELARRRAKAETDALARRERLERQALIFENDTLIGRLTVLATDYDPQLMAGTWHSFRPAMPTTVDGASSGLFGAGIGLIFVIAATLVSRGVRWGFLGRRTAWKT
jgi:hypothetical protein